MFIVKRLCIPTKKCSGSNTTASVCMQSDALPIEGTSCELHNLQYPSESSITNVNNVNQQVVVHFSNINGLQIGSTYKISNNSIDDSTKNIKTSKNKVKAKYPKTLTIDEMMKSQEEPDSEIINGIATHLGSDYKKFMRDLGYSDGQISAKNIDHNVYGVKEVIYQLLMDWVRNEDENGTVGYLTTMLWISGHRECVYRIKPLWKSRSSAKTTKTHC